MNVLEKAVVERGVVLGSEILKVDTFLNHAVDVELMNAIGKEFADYFKDCGITKVMTVETGGIAPAFAAAQFLQVPMVFVKKTEPSTMLDPISSDVFSFTKQKYYPICMEKNYVNEKDRILFVDDFLANGEALKGFERLIAQTGAEIAGVAICIEKRFQTGHPYVRSQGYRYLPLVSIAGFEDGKVILASD